MRRIDRGDAIVFLFLLGFVLAVYSMVMLIPYAYADDYPWLWRSLVQPDTIFPRMAAQGRPLNAIITEWLFRQAGNLAALRGVRFVTVVEIAGMGWLFYLAVLRAGADRTVATMLAALACVVPAMQVYSAWSNSVAIPLAGILAAGAALLTAGAQDRGRIVPLFIAPILLALSASIYQPMTLVFVPIAALDLFRAETRLSKRVPVYAAILAAGLALGWCVFQYGLAHNPQWVRSERSGFTSDASDKIRGFIRHPLMDSLNLFNLRSNGIIAIVVAVIICIGLPLHLSGSPARRLACLCLAAICLPLSFLVNLLAKDDSWSYRTQIGLEWMILVLAWMAVRAIVLKFPRRPYLRCPLTALVLFCGVLAARHVTRLIAWPQSIEQSLLRIALSRPEARAAKRIILLQPTVADSPAPFSRYDEFGIPSTSENNAARWGTNLIRREIDPDAGQIEVDPRPNFVGPWTAPLLPGTVLIDMRSLK